jgi:hypothetical protein
MKSRFGVLAAVLLGFAVEACSRNLPTMPSAADPAAPERPAVSASRSRAQATVFRSAGDITPSVNAFRDALGTLNGNLPGSRTDGRREINWDAVPAQFTNTNDFPVDFFNQPVAGRARGTVFSTPGTGFRTSDNNFTDLNPAFGTEFNFFSPIRTFAPVGSNRMTVNFFVPGSNDAALSTGFGVVFSDVDREGSASIRLFDSEGRSLGRYSAPTSPGGLSFVGVRFSTSIVARVEIVSGQAAVSPDATDVGNRRGDDDDLDDRDDDSARVLAAADHDRDDRDGDHRRPRDLVIMDDFIYGEPIATPAPIASR